MKRLCILILGIQFGLGLAVAADSKVADAASHGDWSAVRALLTQKNDAQKNDVNATQPDGTTALMFAVREDEFAIADQLLRAGANAKVANRYGITAMNLACVNGNPRMMERLIQAGVDVNAPGVEGETALMTVARGGKVEAAKVLLAHGANVHATEEWRGQTALIWAVAQSHPQMVQELIAHGADVNQRTGKQTWQRQVTAEPREKWMPQGYLTPLLFATRQGCVECARVQLDHGADIDAQDLEGVGPLLSSLINGHYDVAGFLIDRGANVNAVDKTGRAALYAAVDFHTMPGSNRPAPKELDNELTSFDVIQKLLAKGANVNARLTAQPPYRSKVDRGTDTVFGAGSTALFRAAKAGDTTVIKLLLDHGADAKFTNRTGINAVMAAAGLGTREEDATGRKKTEAEAIETIHMLLDAGVNINDVDGTGRGAVYGAALWGLDKVVAYLAERGAMLDVKDKRGFTPLDAALGKAGGLGFDQASGNVHPSTAALLRELMSGQNPAQTTANAKP